MGAKFLIDTNVAIDYLAGRLPQNGLNKIEDILNNELAVISIIVKIELLSFNAPYPQDLQIIETLIHRCELIQLEPIIAERTYVLRRTHRIKLPDAIIAATSLVHNCTLLSRNKADFKNIDDLKLINLYEV